MLTDEQEAAVGAESEEGARAMESAMIAAVALAVLASEGGPSAASGLPTLNRALSAAAARSLPALRAAVERDLAGAFALDAATETVHAAGAAALDQSVVDAAVARALAAADEVYPEAVEMARGMQQSAREAYLRACMEARRAVAGYAGGPAVNYRDAAARAVASLARQGLAAYTYQRKDGRTVRVPVDVGVRRAMESAAAERRTAQALEVARAAGLDLVEVSTTAGARPSHRAWQGRVYSVSGETPGYRKFEDACRVGDKVDGIGGYNCRHRVSVYVPGTRRRYPTDPLAGTGLTQEEAYRLRARQARLESDLRALKRERDALRAAGLPSRDVEARLAAKDAELSRHVKAHPALLRRRDWRESAYTRAREAVGALGTVQLDARTLARVRAKAPERAS